MNIPSKAYLDARTKRSYGCSYDEAIAINGGHWLQTPGSLARRYHEHRFNTKKRGGIGWEITFPEWARIWIDSGRWDERGVRRGCYCMARHGDVGPYRVGNVSIQLSIENTSFALSRAPKESKKNRTGTGRGWSFYRGRYCVQFRGKTLGRFATQQEAESVYCAAVEAIGFHASHLQKISPAKVRNSPQQG